MTRKTRLWLWGVVAIALLASFSTACANNPPSVQKPQNSPSTVRETPVPNATEVKWTTLTAGEEGNGIALGQDGTLSQNGKVLLDKIPVSHSSNGSTTYAKSLVVSPPSPSGNFTLASACEGLPREPGLCWSVYLIDRARGKTFKPATGKYGLQNWVQWSADERYAVVASTTDGSWWLHAIDLSAPDKSTSIELGELRPQFDRFAWREGSEFSLAIGQSPTTTLTVNLPVLFQQNTDGCILGTPAQPGNCASSAVKIEAL